MTIAGQHLVDLTSVPPAGIDEFAQSFTSLTRQACGQPSATYLSEGAGQLLAPAALRQEIACGSLVAPYFGVLQEDGSLADRPVAETRIVQTKPRPDYLKPAAAWALVNAGQVLVLGQIEDWLPGASVLVKALKAGLQAQVSIDAYVYGTEAKQGFSRTSDAQVLIVQLEGRSRWSAGDADHADEVELGTDQVLYLPPRMTRRWASDGMDSVFLVVSIQQPTVRDLAELTLVRFYDGPAAAQVAGSHHVQSPEEKVLWLREALQSHLAAEDLAVLARQAVRTRQHEALGY